MTDRLAVRPILRLLFVTALCAGLVPAHALTPRQETGRFDDKQVARRGGAIAVRAVSLVELAPADALRRQWEGFVADNGGGWRVWLDERSGLPTLVTGRGLPWVPGAGNDLSGGAGERSLTELEALAREFLGRHAGLLGRWDGELSLDTAASSRIGRHGRQVVFRHVVDGVQVEGARYDFQIAHGNLVAFGATRWSGVRTSANPSLSRDEARAKLDEHLGLDDPGLLVELAAPELRLIPVDSRRVDATPWTGVRGRGYDHVLAWRFRLTVPGEPPTWVGEVDAHSGEILALFDDTRYEQVKGGVYPVSNTQDAGDPSSQEQPYYPMPFANWTEDGGANNFTGDSGLFTCSTVGSTIKTTLTGQYVRVNDNCGAISETTTCDDDLDLDVSTGTNCAVPSGASAGNTHASRSSYYHLNRIQQMARFWLPGNNWLNLRLTDNVNINSTCNAFWNGTVNFYRRGGGCGNTAEIQAVVSHEWGHGMDQNDGGGYDNPSEAYADVVAIFQARESCVGRGFYESGTCSGYGDTCLTCSGIREMDWDQRAAHTPATPTNFTQPNCGSGSGPCGRAVHCESYVPSESMFDLATRDLPAMGLDADTAWQVAERLFYLSRDGSGGDALNCSLPASDGCGTNNWFHKLRVADDDDGNLDNGTPHATAIFAAFDRHDIACGAAADAANQNSSACPTLQKPAVTVKELTNSVEVDWDDDPNAASYYVLRTEMGCDRSQLVVDQVTAPTTVLLDDGLANDFTVYYRVQSVAANEACVGAVSDCVTATPQALAGTVRFNQATFGCANSIGLRVTDANVGASTVSVDVWSDSEPTPETVVLTETAPGTGKFVGEIFSTSDPAAADGLLTIADGDTITAEYIDADDGVGGTNVPRQRTALGDCVFPIISDVHEENVGLSSARIVWTTDELSDTTVTWGETTPPGTVESGDPRTTFHDVQLSGLAECTTYFYEVSSTDPAGNVAADDNGGSFYRFETLGNFGSGPQPCHAGQVAIDDGVYSCSDTMSFELTDLDLNLDPLTAESITLSVTSSTETTAELVSAVETGPNTSVFRGSITLAAGAAAADGLLQAADGDVLTVTYADADDGSGQPAISFSTAAADCAGPAISNLRVDTLTNARGTVRWNTGENADTVVEWGPTAALGRVASSGGLTTVHQQMINDFQTCTTFHFRVSSTDVHGNTTVLDNGGQPFTLHTFDIPGVYYAEDFEGAAAGWTLEGDWEIDAPQGLGGASGPADPTVAYNNSRVLGHDLTGAGSFAGDYEPNTIESAFSPTLNASSWTDTRLLWHRRLNAGAGDDASVWLYVNGVGRPLFRTEGSQTTQTGYQVESLDIGPLVDGAAAVQLEFKQSANASGQYSGWNVDDVILKDGSLANYAACTDCGGAPSFAGAASAVDNDACGGSGVTVSWAQAVSWGSGAGGTYAVYRDTVPGFTPSPANLVAAGIAGLSYNDLGAPTDQALYYVVRAENSESCGAGPNNGGLTDGNLVHVPVTDATSQSLPGEVVDVIALLVNKAHVRLSWDAAPGASSYRIYRSTSPQPGTFAQIDETTGLAYEDLNQGGNGNSFYYLVRAANACGNEGP